MLGPAAVDESVHDDFVDLVQCVSRFLGRPRPVFKPVPLDPPNRGLFGWLVSTSGRSRWFLISQPDLAASRSGLLGWLIPGVALASDPFGAAAREGVLLAALDVVCGRCHCLLGSVPMSGHSMSHCVASDIMSA